MALKKAVVLIVVLGTMIILTILALVSVNLMTQESRIAEHKIRRIQAYYIAQAGIVHTLEALRRTGALDPNDPGNPNATNINNIAATGYNVAIARTAGTGPSNTDQITATVDYSR